MNTETLIKKLGGTGAVAAACGLGDSAVSNWRAGGVPHKHWHTLIRFAATLPDPVVLTVEQLESTRVKEIASDVV